MSREEELKETKRRMAELMGTVEGRKIAREMKRVIENKHQLIDI
jgi:hypothetical protein